MVRIITILSLLFIATSMMAQSDTLTHVDDMTGYIYQDAFTHDEDDDRFLNSAELFTEYFEHFANYPLLILDPTRLALSEIPFANDIDINRFLELYHSNIDTKPLTVGKSPLARYLITRTSYRTPLIDMRSRFTLDPNAESEGEYVSGSYQGSAMKYYNRLFINTDEVNFGILQAKTAGEPLFFDQVAMHLELSRPYQLSENICVRRFMLGDYSLSFGEGLALQSGVLQMKSRDAILPASHQRTSLNSYLSSSAYRYFRGASTTIDIGSFSVTPFYSERPVDATLTDSGTVSSLSFTGYHRTESELARRNSISQESFGAHAGFDLLREDTRYWNISALSYRTSYSKPVVSGDSLMTRFTGQDLSMYSVASVFATTVYSVRGEFAHSGSDAAKATAFVLSGLIYPFSQTEVTIQLRLLPENFISPFGSVFGDNADDAQNETGVYAGARQRLEDFTLQGYVDLSRRDLHEYDASYTPLTHDYRFTAGYTSSTQRTVIELDSRFRTREDTRRDTLNATHLYSSTKLSERLIGRFTLTDELLLIGRVGFIHYSEDNVSDDGFAFGVQARYYPLPSLSLEAALSYFTTDSYDSRIYLNESDLPGAVSLTSLYGTGERYYLMVRYAPLPELSLGAKLSGSFYDYNGERFTPTLISGQIDIRF